METKKFSLQIQCTTWRGAGVQRVTPPFNVSGFNDDVLKTVAEII